MKATCPKSEFHKRFIPSAHVVEDWVVDEHGHFQETIVCVETIHGPDPDNIWTCYVCGATATVTRDE